MSDTSLAGYVRVLKEHSIQQRPATTSHPKHAHHKYSTSIIMLYTFLHRGVGSVSSSCTSVALILSLWVSPFRSKQTLFQSSIANTYPLRAYEAQHRFLTHSCRLEFTSLKSNLEWPWCTFIYIGSKVHFTSLLVAVSAFVMFMSEFRQIIV